MNYIESKSFILDFSKCEYLGEIHKEIKDNLQLPDWYGENLDALWDAITGIMHTPANITIIYKPVKESAQVLSQEVDNIIDVFLEAEQEYGDITLNIIK
ncbi:MAG: barnase inhibitor [Ruminococcaceae bacterium]|nr:barnase inhibitor [Oscillospiraceae bacterium]